MLTSMNRPVLRHVANLGTLVEHPSKETEWSLDEKLAAIKEAGFAGVTWALRGQEEGIGAATLVRVWIASTP